MKIRISLFPMVLFICSCTISPMESNYPRTSAPGNEIGGLDNWGRGPDPWLTDRERKQKENMREVKRLEALTKKRGGRG